MSIMFYNAVVENNLDEVDLLLSEEEIDVHADDELAFETAVEKGHLRIVNRLLELTEDRRINVHAKNGRAFEVAAMLGHLQIVNRLLELTGDRSMTGFIISTLHSVLQTDHTLVIDRLFELIETNQYGPPHDLTYVFQQAILYDHLSIVNRLLELPHGTDHVHVLNVHDREEIAFRYAVQHGRVSIVNRLLEMTGDRKINVHYRGNWFFMLAIKYDQLQIVNLFLSLQGERKIDIHSGNYRLFDIAMSSNCPRIVIRLLDLEGPRKIRWSTRFAQCAKFFVRRFLKRRINILRQRGCAPVRRST